MTEQELTRYHKETLKTSEQEQEQEQQRHDDIARFLSEASVVNLKQVLHTQVCRVTQQM